MEKQIFQSLMSINKLRFVHFYTGNIFEVQKLRETLLEANIKTLVKDESESARFAAVSYTHLTLPTIYSV